MKYLFTVSLVAIIAGSIGLIVYATFVLRQHDLVSKCVVTFLGVFLALFLNSIRDQHAEDARFKANLHAWKYELEMDLSQIKKIHDAVRPTTAAYFRLRCDVAKYLLTDKATYKYGKKGLHEVLGIVVTRTEAFNMLNESISQKIATSGSVSEGVSDQVKNRAQQTRFGYEIAMKLLSDYLNDDDGVIEKEKSYPELSRAFAVERASNYEKYEFK